MICERCSEQAHIVEKCIGCSKQVCNTCVKAAKRVKKLKRVAICKDCWGKIGARSKWKKA